MIRTILAYGAILGAFVLLIKWIQYRFEARDITIEIYFAVVAAMFGIFGLWAGKKLFDSKPEAAELGSYSFMPDQSKLQSLELSQCEFEVLNLIANGMSNQEIADRLFISPNTVKTHSSSLFSKLGVKRRTQAIMAAKALGLLSN